MLAAWCDTLGKQVLVYESDITGVRNVDGVIVVGYRCWCGAPGALVTGKAVSEDRSGHLVAA